MTVKQVSLTQFATHCCGVIPRLSIRGVLFTLAFLTAWLAWLLTLPHVAVFLLGPILVITSTILIIKNRSCCSKQIRRVMITAFTIFSWAVFYVLSFGPVIALSTYDVFPHGMIRSVYAPVYWLAMETPVLKPMESYFNDWQICWGRQQ